MLDFVSAHPHLTTLAVDQVIVLDSAAKDLREQDLPNLRTLMMPGSLADFEAVRVG